jgi:hypothetical protein
VSAPTPSRERAIGREVLSSDPLLEEALLAFAETDDRKVPNAVGFLLRRVLFAWGWLALTPRCEWVPGHHLVSYRRSKDPDAGDLALVVPLARPGRENIV